MTFRCWYRSSIVTVFLIYGITGCAAVDPKPDFARTSELVAQRSGVDAAFRDESDEVVKARTQTLLDGGLTVEKAVKIALINNPDFQALFDQVGASRADVVQSQLLTNPTFTITMLLPEGGGRAKIPFNIGQELTDLWQIPVKKRIAEAQLEQTVLAVAHKGVDIATETRIACYKLLALQRLDTLTQEQVDFLAGLEKQGGADGASMNAGKTHAALLEGRLAAIATHRDAQIARATLAKDLGLSRWPGEWKLVAELPAAALSTGGETELVAFASSERLDVRATDMQLAAAEEQVTRSYLNVFPKVVFGLGAEQKDRRPLAERNVGADTVRSSFTKDKLTAPTIQSQDQREFARRQIIDFLTGPMFQITLPIWDQNQAQIAKARFTLEQRRREREGLLNGLAQDIQQSYAQLAAAREQFVIYDEQLLPAAQSNLKNAEALYKSGQVPLLNVIDARKALLASSQNDLNARRDYAVALATLQRAVGGKLPGKDVSAPASSPAKENVQ